MSPRAPKDQQGSVQSAHRGVCCERFMRLARGSVCGRHLVGTLRCPSPYTIGRVRTGLGSTDATASCFIGEELVVPLEITFWWVTGSLGIYMRDIPQPCAEHEWEYEQQLRPHSSTGGLTQSEPPACKGGNVPAQKYPEYRMLPRRSFPSIDQPAAQTASTRSIQQVVLFGRAQKAKSGHFEVPVQCHLPVVYGRFNTCK